MAKLTTGSPDLTLDGLQARVKALVGRVREGVTSHVLTPPAGGDRAATGLMDAVPLGVGVRLVQVWHAARDAGYDQAALTARLGEDERLVFEMVLGMYDTACHVPLPKLLASVTKLRDALT